MTGIYYAFSDYLKKMHGEKVRKISLNAGFSCPNRDRTIKASGCIYCNEKGFARYAESSPPTLKEQIEISMRFSKERFKVNKFIAYFQNGTNTYADRERLKKAYDVVREFSNIVGLSISTRPDCVDSDTLGLIGEYTRDLDVWIEYGVQSMHDKTLALIKRGHSAQRSKEIIEETARHNIKVGAHLILGLPGESRDEMLETARWCSALPLSGIKYHALHVLRDTELERMYNEGTIELLREPEYVSLVCDFLERQDPKCAVLRIISDARQEVLIAPDWINQKARVIRSVLEEMKRRGTYQGKMYEEKKGMCIRQL